MRLEQRFLFERVIGPRVWLRVSKLVEQIRTNAAWIEELLQLDRRKFADLLLGVVDAALFADTCADLLHDLLDVDRVGADIEIGHKDCQLSAVSF